MIISEKKQTAVYDAICNPIMKLRVEQSAGLSIEEMDERLYNLQTGIADGVAKALNLTKSK